MLYQTSSLDCIFFATTFSEVWTGPADVWKLEVIEENKVIHRRVLDDGQVVLLGTGKGCYWPSLGCEIWFTHWLITELMIRYKLIWGQDMIYWYNWYNIFKAPYRIIWSYESNHSNDSWFDFFTLHFYCYCVCIRDKGLRVQFLGKELSFCWSWSALINQSHLKFKEVNLFWFHWPLNHPSTLNVDSVAITMTLQPNISSDRWFGCAVVDLFFCFDMIDGNDTDYDMICCFAVLEFSSSRLWAKGFGYDWGQAIDYRLTLMIGW